MPTTYRPYQPEQPLLLPPDLQEWVPPGHLGHHVSDVVDALDWEVPKSVGSTLMGSRAPRSFRSWSP